MRNLLNLQHILHRVRGFTLIETFVAITILMLAIAGPLSIASLGVNSATLESDQVTATFLAQDAVEYIRYVRDSKRLQGKTWLDSLGNCISSDGSAKCYIDEIAICSDSSYMCANQCGSGSGPCDPIKFDSVSGFYSYSAGSNSKFTRTISIQYPVGGGGPAPSDCTSGHGCEAALTVTVDWQTAGHEHTVTVRENLLNWQ